MKKKLLEMKNIKKSFNKNVVLDNVDLLLNKGEILGIIGENGAGKSTLIKILCGVYQKDSGEIFINEEKTEIQDTAHSQKLGITTIYQELSLFLDMNAVENMFIHREITKTKSVNIFSHLNINEMKEKARSILLEKLLFNIDLEKPLRYLSLSERQIIEIARSIYTDARIIIMDEPTTALESKERERLFQIMKGLKKIGKSIIFISHHLDEVLNICDQVMVLRDGKKITQEAIENININKLIRMMIGKSLELHYPEKEISIGTKIMKVSELCRKNCFKDISFDLHQGEILGIVGMAGCGKSEVLRSLFGVFNYDSGKIYLRGKEIEIKNIDTAKKNKIAFVPAERKTEGLFPIQSTSWNMSIAAIDKIINNSYINRSKENEITRKYINELKIKVDSPDQNVSFLSGGNQQKVILARWLFTDADILLLEDPTRGIDVNAKSDFYRLIMSTVKENKSVIFVSSEEEEVLGICDRIIVMYKGKISSVLDAKNTTLEEIKYFSVNSK